MNASVAAMAGQSLAEEAGPTAVPLASCIYTTTRLSRTDHHLTILMPDIFVKSFTHLKDRPNANRALPLLQRVASLVKPIMRKHGWVLPVLSEFFPESPNLLGKRSLPYTTRGANRGMLG